MDVIYTVAQDHVWWLDLLGFSQNRLRIIMSAKISCDDIRPLDFGMMVSFSEEKCSREPQRRHLDLPPIEKKKCDEKTVFLVHLGFSQVVFPADNFQIRAIIQYPFQ